MIYRVPTETDKQLTSKWLEKDEFHTAAGITLDDLFKSGTKAIMACDDKENPLIAIRAHLALRIAMQFNPDSPYRTAKVAKQVVEDLQKTAQDYGALEVIILPGGKAWNFAEKLGFRPFNGLYIPA